MILRKKGFTLIEMLVVIMIIAILAAALFPAINAAIAQAKSTAVKQKGRGIWSAVLSANSERESLGMLLVWPTDSCADSTAYFKYLLGYGNFGAGTLGSAICEDLKAPTLVGPGMTAATDASSFGAANNAWCAAGSTASNIVSEDAFIYTRNIDFGSGIANKGTMQAKDESKLILDAQKLGGFNLNRGIYVTYGGACIDRRDKYIGRDVSGNIATNNLVSSTNTVTVFRPATGS